MNKFSLFLILLFCWVNRVQGACEQRAFHFTCDRSILVVKALSIKDSSSLHKVLDSVVAYLQHHKVLDAKIELHFTGSAALDEESFLKLLTELQDKNLLGRVRRLSFEGAPINPDVIVQQFANYFGRIGDELWSLDRLPKEGAKTYYAPYRLVKNPITGDYCPESVQ